MHVSSPAHQLLGIISNLNLADCNFSRVLLHYKLVDFLYSGLLPGNADDDIVLEIVILIGALATDPKCIPLLSKSRLLQQMFEVLKGIRTYCMVRLSLFVIDKGEEDEEITLQTVFAFCKFIQHKDSRAVLLNSTRAILLFFFRIAEKCDL